jgi:hypothetical protein
VRKVLGFAVLIVVGIAMMNAGKNDKPAVAAEPAKLAPAPSAPAESFGFGDVHRILETMRENELRFERDYAGKSFDAVGPFYSVTKMTFPWWEYRVAFRGLGSSEVECHFKDDDPALNAVTGWKKGQLVRVQGAIRGKNLIGDLRLKDCVLTPAAKTAKP